LPERIPAERARSYWYSRFLVERALALIYLYHLRLDWLTWFAAMDSPKNGLYFPPVAHR